MTKYHTIFPVRFVLNVRRACVLLLLIIGASPTSGERTEPVDVPADVYALARLEVNAPILDSRRKWIHGCLGNIHVLATLSEKYVTRALQDMAVFREFAGQFGSEFSPRANSEVWIVLAGDADDILFFARDPDRNAYSTLAADTVFIFTHFEERNPKYLERSTRRKWLSAVHEADFPDSPLWLIWANSRIMADMEIRGDRIAFGQLLGDQQLFLNNLFPIPLEDLFSIKRTLVPSLSRYSGGRDRFIATRQAAAFMHFCLFGSKGKYAAAFQQVREKGRHAVVTEQDFISAFEMSFNAMEKLIYHYTNTKQIRYETHHYRVKGTYEDHIIIALCTPEELAGFEKRFRRAVGK